MRQFGSTLHYEVLLYDLLLQTNRSVDGDASSTPVLPVSIQSNSISSVRISRRFTSLRSSIFIPGLEYSLFHLSFCLFNLTPLVRWSAGILLKLRLITPRDFPGCNFPSRTSVMNHHIVTRCFPRMNTGCFARPTLLDYRLASCCTSLVRPFIRFLASTDIQVVIEHSLVERLSNFFGLVTQSTIGASSPTPMDICVNGSFL